LFEWENLLLKLLDNNKRENKILLSLDHRLGLLNQLSNELELMDTAIRVKLIASKDPKFKTPENRETLESLVQNKLEINNVESLSLIAKRQYYYLQSEYYGTQNKWEIAHQAAKKLIDSYSDEDRIDIIATHKYKNDLCNYLFISDCAQKVDNYLTTINKLDALSSKDDMRMFNTIQFKLLIYHLNNYNFESAKETSKNIESKWNELCTFIPKRRQLAYHYNIMVAYWFGGDPTTMYWLSKILTFENNKEGQRYVNLSRIVQLPICYDYDYENLENRIESARKVLKSRSELNEYRKTIISYFRRLVRCVSNQDKKECIFDMQTKLNKIQSEQNINSGDLGCILLWCKLKLGEKIVKNQLQQSPKSNFFKTKL